MEDMMMVMKMRSSSRPHENPRKITSISAKSNTICPTWKLYENPFYISQKQHQQSNQKNKQIHHLHLPISARKIAASFWDLTFIKPLMESELENARTQILELKTELENERKARRKMENVNKKISKELSEERKGKEALGKVCEELAKEISYNKEEINRLKKEMEEERKMLRVAEVLREERVQMKLSEAKQLLEEKIFELEKTKQMQKKSSSSIEDEIAAGCVLTEKSNRDNNKKIGNGGDMAMEIHRKASTEAENPHIKRGIKGFVEFPKVVKAIGSKSIKNSGAKLECEKAQTKMLLMKQKSPLRSNNTLITLS